jgi:hypothetical protein
LECHTFPFTGSTSQTQHTSTKKDTHKITISGSDVPAGPINTAVGGKASLQPKRTPVSDKEIEAILVRKIFRRIIKIKILGVGINQNLT